MSAEEHTPNEECDSGAQEAELPTEVVQYLAQFPEGPEREAEYERLLIEVFSFYYLPYEELTPQQREYVDYANKIKCRGREDSE